jgi:hypothetical protein
MTTASAKKPRARRVVTPPPPTSAPAPEGRPTAADNLRMQVPATEDQSKLLDAAADAAGYANARATGGRGAWILKVSLAAAHAQLSGQVVTFAGDLAAQLKAEAERDGLTVEAYLERAITMSRAVRAAQLAPAAAVPA